MINIAHIKNSTLSHIDETLSSLDEKKRYLSGFKWCIISIMSEWVDKVLKGESGSDCFPLSVPPQKKYAVMLETRLKLLKEDYLPIIEKGFVAQ